MHGLTCSVTYSQKLYIVKEKFIVDDVNLSVLQVAFYFINQHYKKDFHTSTKNLLQVNSTLLGA